MVNIGVWGSGIVGTATGHIFEHFCPNDVNVIYYDRFKNPYRGNEIQLLKESKFIFICLPTPMKVTGEIDLSYINNAMVEIALFYQQANRKPEELPIIIIRSTSVSGSTDKLAERYPDFKFAFCPEFLTERNFLQDAVNTDRIVIGANSEEVYQKIERLFSFAFKDSVNYFQMRIIEAETLKYMSNVFLAGQALLANEMYFICKKVGANYDTIKNVLRFDVRIGTFTQVPGHDGDFGVGGKCFPKDLAAFAHLAKQIEAPSDIMDAMIHFNDKIRKNKDWIEIPGAVTEKGYN